MKNKTILILALIILVLGCSKQRIESITEPEGVNVTWNFTTERTEDFRTWEEHQKDGEQNAGKFVNDGPTVPNITGTEEAENILKIDNSTKIGRPASTEEQKSEPPVIKNLGVNFAPYDSLTKKAGDFLFTVSNPRDGKILGEFGQKVKSSSGNTKLLPHYTYYIPKNTPITAVADGEVIMVSYQEQTKDYGIYTKPVYDSYWDVSYDHVLDPLVKENDTIKAGDIIAYAGDYKIVPLEISLESEKEKVGTSRGAYYPLLSNFDPALKEEFGQKVWKLLSDWETYKGNNNIYDEEAMTACPACLESSLPDVYN